MRAGSDVLAVSALHHHKMLIDWKLMILARHLHLKEQGRRGTEGLY